MSNQIGQLFPFEDDEIYRPDYIDERFHLKYRICGALFAGTTKTLIEFANIHFNTLNDAKINHVFSGDDQYIYAFDILRYPDLFKLVQPPYYFGCPCYPYLPGNPWFFLAFYLSNLIIDWTEIIKAQFPLNCGKANLSIETIEDFQIISEHARY